MIISFLCFLLFFTFIGLLSATKSKGTKKDYYLASSEIKPWLVGLSAVATNNSGYMFIGVIGYTYTTGLPSIWLMIGWILGDFLASLFIHKRLRLATEKSHELSYAGVLSNWYGQDFRTLKLVIGLISIVFLSTYASAQLLAGSKALHVLFGWPFWMGAVIGAVLVSIYCLVGGIRASIWTDAAQSIVMIVAMAIMMISSVNHFGGLSAVLDNLNQIDAYMNWFPSDLLVPGISGLFLFVLAWLFAGLSVIGQPHIMVRFMSLNESNKIKEAKIYYYIWFTAFYAMATAVGLLARIYFTEVNSFDAELALPSMAKDLLHPALSGLILAGIFAATMSTADSLVLSCSATLSNDFFNKKLSQAWQYKLSTLLVVAFSLLLALNSSDSVFNIVIFAWSGLASAFAPLLIFLSLGNKASEGLSISAVIIGFMTALLWREFDLHLHIYEGLPGIIMGLIVLYGGQLLQKNDKKALNTQPNE